MKGQFTEVRFDATINLGNYESEKIGVTYALAEEENVFEALSKCKEVVYGNKTETKATPASAPASTPTAPVVEKKAPSMPKKKDAEVKAPKAEEKAEEKTEAPKAEEKAEEKTEAAPAEKKTEAKRTIAKVKNTVYDRTKEEHKRILSNFLTKDQPDWKNRIKRASEVSAELTGKEDFLDGDGNLLDSFKAKFLELFNG